MPRFLFNRSSCKFAAAIASPSPVPPLARRGGEGLEYALNVDTRRRRLARHSGRGTGRQRYLHAPDWQDHDCSRIIEARSLVVKSTRTLVNIGMETRVTVISDTHCRHDEMNPPAGDLLIHCGDMFNLSSRAPRLISEMDEWFGRQKFERILCTGGNHDRILETDLTRRSQPFRNAHFLKDEVVEFRGLKIFGAPWVPDLKTHAFFQSRSSLASAWARVPADVDILVTHTPPKGILDTSSRGRSLGCPSLADELKRISPRVHCFGHVHAAAGSREVGKTLFINAASFDGGTGLMRTPMTFTLSLGKEPRISPSWRTRIAQRWLDVARR